MSRTRVAVRIGLFFVCIVVLAACAEQHQSAPGPLGMDGDSWFFIIVLGIVALGGALEEFARSRRGNGRRPRRRDEDS